ANCKMRTLRSDKCLTCLQPVDAQARHIADLQLQRLLLQQLDWRQRELQAERLPRQVCGSCCQQLQSCAQFQQQARQCRQQLLQMLREHQQVEQEKQQEWEQAEEQEEKQPQAEQQEEEQAQQLELEAETETEATKCFEIVYEQQPPTGSNEEPQERAPDPIDEHVRQEQADQAKPADTPRTTRRCKGARNAFKCTQCGHSFAHSLTLSAHVRKVHEGSKRPFQCDRCDKAYSWMGGLYTHIKELHSAQERSYACDAPGCDRVYISSIAMQKHKRMKHSPAGTGDGAATASAARKYVCEQCGATFNQTANLKYHRRTKHPTEAEAAANARDSARHYCELCRKHFHSRYTLQYHTLQQHAEQLPQQHECQVCGRRMAKRFMLVQHMLMHSAEKMPCEHCGRLFARKFELEAHIRAVHLKLKPFACAYCSECFASRKTLRHHEYIHTGEKPYVCDVCGQAFRQQTCLKNHAKLHER
ncbi:hypothetical protein KR222_007367, partial [Zaprionus bogoriensis]